MQFLGFLFFFSLLIFLLNSFHVFYFSFSPWQTRQPVFVQLLQGVFRVYHCSWLTPTQKASVESCIKVLSDVGKNGRLVLSQNLHSLFSSALLHVYKLFALHAAKSRAIAIPVDLDSQVNNLFVKSNNVVQKTILNWRMSARNASRRDSTISASKDYRNIIERLQVNTNARMAVTAGERVWCTYST